MIRESRRIAVFCCLHKNREWSERKKLQKNFYSLNIYELVPIKFRVAVHHADSGG